MSCPSSLSAEDVSIWYAPEADLSRPLFEQRMWWTEVPVRSESLTASVTATVSARIGTVEPDLVVTSRDVGGSLTLEAEANQLFANLLIAVLQADVSPRFHPVEPPLGSGYWAAGAQIRNGSRRHCFAFLKRIRAADGRFDWYAYRQVEVDRLKHDASSGDLVLAEVSLLGTRMDPPVEDHEPPALWFFESPHSTNLMSGHDAIVESGGLPPSIIDLAIDLGNSLRTQRALSRGGYAGGSGTGRMSVQYDLSAHYFGAAQTTAMHQDTWMDVSVKMRDSFGKGFDYRSAAAKPVSDRTVTVDSTDSDLVVQGEIRGFDRDNTPSLAVTRVTGVPPLACAVQSEECTLQTTDGCAVMAAPVVPLQESLALTVDFHVLRFSDGCALRLLEYPYDCSRYGMLLNQMSGNPPCVSL